MERRKILEDMGYEDLIVFDNPAYDSAIIGVSDDNRVVYDYDKMVEDLMMTEGMDMLDAADFISYNTIGTHSPIPGSDPIIMYRLPDINITI